MVQTFTMFIECVQCKTTKLRRHFKIMQTVGEEYICNVCNNVKEPKVFTAYPRTCLKCDNDFRAENKYVRLCQSCKRSTDLEDYNQWERE